MKILVTGFIGSGIGKNKNNSVYSLDNYSTGTKKNHVEGVTYIQGETLTI